MISETQSRQEFFTRARFEAARYGRDPWVFLRELVQNSRDAGADNIEISVKETAGLQQIRVSDNGSGMSLDHFERYLLRLYASSKEENQDSVGFFGVGFWSILLFEPDTIDVCSVWQGQARAFKLDCHDYSLNQLAPGPGTRGTEITLTRSTPPFDPADPDLAARVRERLIYYVGPLRAPGKGPAPGLWCNGEMINQDFILPEIMGEPIKHRSFDGVIGFGAVPSIKIYKGGILVRDLTSLEEVIPRRKLKPAYSGPGLYPVVSVNLDKVQILMDRQKIYEDQSLHDFVSYCEERLQQMHKVLIHKFFPIDLKNRFFNLNRTSLIFLAIMVLSGITGTIAGRMISSLARSNPAGFAYFGGAPQLKVEQAIEGWQGTGVASSSVDKLIWDFHYEGPEKVLFHIGTLGRFDPVKGFFPEENRVSGPYPNLQPYTNLFPIAVQMGVTGSQTVINLPVPRNSIIVNDSVQFDGEPLAVFLNQYGEPVIEAPGPGRVTWSVLPGQEPLKTTPYPEIDYKWPEKWQAVIEDAVTQPEMKRVELLESLLRAQFRYSEDPGLAPHFRNEQQQWLDKVFAAGEGDCDVLNGLAVLLLREVGIDAYLCLGMVGIDGSSAPMLHAWVRYFAEGWETMDLTLSPQGENIPTNLEIPESRSLGSDIRELNTGNLEPTERVAPTPFSNQKLLDRRLLLVIPGVLLLMGLLWASRRSRTPILAEPENLDHLFLHYFRNQHQQDPFNLCFRPVLALLGSNRRLSWFELERMALRKTILAGHKDSPLLGRLSSNAIILDLAHSTTQKLLPLLPFVDQLSDCEAIGNGLPLPVIWKEALSRIQQLEPDFRVHLIQNSKMLREVVLPFSDKSSGRFHLLIGENHPRCAALRDLSKGNRPLAVFETARLFMEQATFFLAEKDLFLANLAAESAGGILDTA